MYLFVILYNARLKAFMLQLEKVNIWLSLNWETPATGVIMLLLEAGQSSASPCPSWFAPRLNNRFIQCTNEVKRVQEIPMT